MAGTIVEEHAEELGKMSKALEKMKTAQEVFIDILSLSFNEEGTLTYDKQFEQNRNELAKFGHMVLQNADKLKRRCKKIAEIDAENGNSQMVE